MSELRFQLAGLLGKGALSSLFATVRLTREGYEPIRALRSEGQKVIFCFWHGGLLPLAWVHRDEGVVVLVSEHADGEYITRVLHRYGYETARGSSTRGGSRGLRGLLRSARAGRDLAITPDGPRGPLQEFKPGAVTAAQLTGLPILPLGVAASSAWRLESWDRFMIPRPFCQLHVVYGEPIYIPRSLSDGEVAELAGTCGEAVQRATDRAWEALDG